MSPSAELSWARSARFLSPWNENNSNQMRAPNHYYSNKNLSSPVCQPYRHLNYSHFLMTNKVISMICCNNNTKWLSENHTHSLSINERDCRFKWNASADATYMQNRMMPAKINCHHCERGNAFTKCFIMYLVVQLYIVHWTWSMKQDKTKTKNQIHLDCLLARHDYLRIIFGCSSNGRTKFFLTFDKS